MRLPPRMAARRGLGVDKTNLLSERAGPRDWRASESSRTVLLNSVQDRVPTQTSSRDRAPHADAGRALWAPRSPGDGRCPIRRFRERLPCRVRDADPCRAPGQRRAPQPIARRRPGVVQQRLVRQRVASRRSRAGSESAADCCTTTSPSKRDFYVEIVRLAAQRPAEPARARDRRPRSGRAAAARPRRLPGFVADHSAGFVTLLRGGIGSDPEVRRSSTRPASAIVAAGAGRPRPRAGAGAARGGAARLGRASSRAPACAGSRSPGRRRPPVAELVDLFSQLLATTLEWLDRLAARA